ncbi:Epimerase family protein [Polystyrenella longa]|uniref:Epimerase family protein n=1 Tax=Polystyrenella longa TaxID=2528007 RepID=A0A518CS53_9PLAN|nr:TIGR01777 family oxidoreductase [Polystyrenella longa]QDU82059.1 Epimerase family protein [Polystyrenella longa]
MKVAITGATGLVGRALTQFLEARGDQVFPVTRSKEGKGMEAVFWSPQEGEIEKNKLEGIDAVVHLAGENIASGRWTPELKRKIVESREKGTRLLAETIAGLENPPEVLISSSAIGYYGDRGESQLTEESAPGTGFLPDTCKLWEGATTPASDAGIRVAIIRTGIVLSKEGGALQKMLLPFKLGLGGKVGSGKQYWSWVALEDLVRIIHFAMTHPKISGPVNGTAPCPVTNYEFTKTLGKVLKRPTCLPVPAFAVRTALGEMADDLLLASANVIPAKLEQEGFLFELLSLEDALQSILKKS